MPLSEMGRETIPASSATKRKKLAAEAPRPQDGEHVPAVRCGSLDDLSDAVARAEVARNVSRTSQSGDAAREDEGEQSV